VSAVRDDGVQDGFAQIHPEVEPVGYLDGVRCPDPDAVGVCAGTVTAHDLCAGMRAQPRGEGVRGAVGQHIDRLVCVHVDQHGGVDLTTTQGEVVHPEHLGRPTRRCWRGGTQQPQQGAAAGRDRELGRESGAGTTSQRDTDVSQHRPERRATPATRHGQLGHLLGESPLRAGRVLAVEPPYLQQDPHRRCPQRGVRQPPPVPLTHRPRDHLAGGAGRLVSVDLGMDMHPVGPVLDPLDAHLAQVTRQHTNRLLILHRDMISISGLSVKRCWSTPRRG
jgi:hypothetical protein